jgi:tetratricopeptide (TPR) repeat protein
MKKTVLLVNTLLALGILACASGGSAAPSAAPGDGLSLEAGIAQIAAEIERSLSVGTRVAVINFKSPSALFSDFVLEELQGILIQNKKLTVLDRKNLELRRNELTFQMSGEVSDETAVSVGHALGAESIVTGSLTDMGGRYRFRFGAFNIETTQWQVSAAATVVNDRTIAYMLPAERGLPATVPARPDPQLAVLYFNSGFAHYEAGEYAAAVADFSRALEMRSNDVTTLRYRGNAYYYLKDYDQAISDISAWIRLEPDNAEAYLGRGVCYSEKKEWDAAIADYNQAIRLDPNLAAAYNNRGIVYGNKSDHDRAIINFNQAIRLAPNYAAVYNNRGAAYVGKGDYDRAIADCNQAIRLDPNYAEAYNSRGASYAGKGDYDRAIIDFNQAIRLDPNNAMAYNNRGAAYAGKGDYDRAIADLNQAIRLDPNNAMAYNNRSAAYSNKGDYARARADFAEVLRLGSQQRAGAE